MWVVFLCVLALLLFMWARKATAACDQKGKRFHAPLSAGEVIQGVPRRLKVATYNVQTGKDLNGKRDIKRSANAMSGVDIAGVQEVYAPSWLNKLGLGTSQTQALAIQGGFHFLFCATRRRWFREHRGNALLSRFQCKDWRITMLPDWSGKSYRNLSVARFELSNAQPDQELVILNTHLHTKKGRVEQLRIVLEELESYPCAILLGDFNSKHDQLELAQFFAKEKGIDLISQAGLDDADRIDWMIGRGVTAVGGRRLDKGISDHPYYEIDVQIDI